MCLWACVSLYECMHMCVKLCLPLSGQRPEEGIEFLRAAVNIFWMPECWDLESAHDWARGLSLCPGFVKILYYCFDCLRHMVYLCARTYIYICVCVDAPVFVCPCLWGIIKTKKIKNSLDVAAKVLRRQWNPQSDNWSLCARLSGTSRKCLTLKSA